MTLINLIFEYTYDMCDLVGLNLNSHYNHFILNFFVLIVIFQNNYRTVFLNKIYLDMCYLYNFFVCLLYITTNKNE